MSFGFAIGDFIAVGELAWRLYCDCYKTARGAPQEFQLLVGEVSTLSNSLKILQEETKDPDSALVRAGEDRVRMVNEMVRNIDVTLKSLEKVARKYEILGSNSKRKLIWTKLKWSVEFTSIDGLRNKLVYHNTVMNLLLTSVGNSSLQRIESSTDALENDVREIKSYITGQRVIETPLIPSISTVDDGSETLALSASLMRNAEVLQPWSTIGVDQWIESGRWWLLRSQMELHDILKPGQEVPLAPYTSLIKASWILVDIISCHPQVPFLSATTHSEVQMLSAELKSEFLRLRQLGTLIPDLQDLETQDLRIWETQSKGPLLRSQKGPGSSKTPVSEEVWRVDGGEEVLFQRFAMLKMQALPDPIPCIILFLVNHRKNEIRLSAQNQNGSVMMAISLRKEVKLEELDGCDLILNNEQITFASHQDTQMLCSLVEAANFHYSGSLDLFQFTGHLRALALMFAVKAQRRETAAHFLERLPSTVHGDGIALGHPSIIASDLAREQAKGVLNEMLCPENQTPRKKLPLFQWAIECNHINLAALLISKHAVETGGESWRQMHPLSLACRCGHEAIAKLLIHDVDRKNYNGWWPLHAAAYYGHTKIVRLLLRNGADVDPRHTGLTPLSMAARHGHRRTVELLLDKGAHLENKSFGLYTPLHEACDTNQEEVITLLVEEGADCTSPKDDNLTPYHIALERGVSKTTFDLIASKYFAKLDRTPNVSPARLHIRWTVDSDWGKLWLDSPGAYFVHTDPLPPNVRDMQKHCVEVRQPVGTTTQFFTWTYECDVVYSTTHLHFSTGHGSLGSTKSYGNTSLSFVGIDIDGQQVVTTPKITTTPTNYPSNFRSHPGVKVTWNREFLKILQADDEDKEMVTVN